MSLRILKAAFEFAGITVPLENLLPSRTFSVKEKDSMKYRSLLASIQEVGIVEPLSVFPQNGGKYLILDGHARVEAQRDLGITETPCLVASQEESYTYNKKVNRIPPIQANKMILRALEAGVPEERIAKALNLSASTVRGHRSLLKDICPEAVQILQDKQIAQETIAAFKRVKPIRQIEMAELMVGTGSYSALYAKALVRATFKEQLVNPDRVNHLPGVKPEDLARIEHEVRIQEKDFRMIDETYNEQVLALTLARGWLRPLLENARIVRFLAQNYREYLDEFHRILESGSLAR